LDAFDGSDLASGFLRSAEATPGSPALEVAGQIVSYEMLRERAAQIAATLRHHDHGDSALSAVFAARSVTAFAGVLGCLMSRHGYVPLNPTFPAARSRAMMERAGCRALVVDEASVPLLADLVNGFAPGMLVVVPDRDDVAAIRAAVPNHHVIGRTDLEPADRWSREVAAPDAVAYLLFTSGSTGAPKGVMVTHSNARAFIDVMNRWQISPADRVSQVFDLTFDVSVADMFLTWEGGACLCCPTAAQVRKPGRFLRESRVSIWFSVPSVAMFMRRFGELTPGQYPDLRLSAFGGEALTAAVASDWARAAPNSVIENCYGPTEVTVMQSGYVWDEASSPARCVNGIVPIGEIFAGLSGLIVDDDLREVTPGEPGELILSGPQVTPGYWRDPELTARAFVIPPGRTEIHYRTGDRVRRLDGGRGPMVFLGRMDGQVQVLGHRVELGEVEAVVREVGRVDAVVALGWPPTDSGSGGVVCFVGADDLDVDAVRRELSQRLPEYMVPRQLRVMPQLPLNVNGKFDRRALRGLLEAER
jgi:amino acid adenylation domain-containing protein